MSRIPRCRGPSKQTATTSTVTLSAKGGCKAGETTKVQSRSGSARPVKKGTSDGPTQARKSEENAQKGNNRGPSKTRNEVVPMSDSSNNSTTQPTPPSPIKGKGQYTDRFGHVIPIIVDLPQTPIATTISSTPAESNDHERPLETNNGDTAPITTDAATTDVATAGAATIPRTNRPQINEVCRQYLRFQCPWGRRCHRLHPERPVLLRSRIRPKIDEICRNFTNGYCHFGDCCDRLHPPPNDAKPNDSVTLSRPDQTPAANIGDVPIIAEGSADSAASIIDADIQGSTPVDMNCSSVVEKMTVEQSPAESLTNMSHTNTAGSLLHESRYPKKLCRGYLVHQCFQGHRCYRWHPPATEISKILAEEQARPKQSESCIQFLRGRCHWGTICTFTHPEPEGSKPEQSISLNSVQLDVNASEAIRTVPANTSPTNTSSTRCVDSTLDHVQDAQPEAQSTSRTALRTANQKSTGICNDIPDSNCRDGDKQLHPSTKLPTSSIALGCQTPKQSVNKTQNTDCSFDTLDDLLGASSIQSTPGTKVTLRQPQTKQVCRRYLAGINHGKFCRYLHPLLDQPEQTASDQSNEASKTDESSSSGTASLDEHESFSRSLVDTSSTADTPLVNIPKTGRSAKKTGRLKGNRGVRTVEKAPLSTSAITRSDVTEISTDKCSINVPTFAEAQAGNEVVNLPSPRSVFAASGKDQSATTEQASAINRRSGEEQPSPNNFNFSAESFAALSSCSHTNGAVAHVPASSGICIDWLRGCCQRGPNCKYLHANYASSHDYDRLAKRCQSDPVTVQKAVYPQGPLEKDKNWPLRQNRYESALPPPPGLPIPAHLREPPSHMTVTVLEHTKVNLGAGFEVREVTTGFESRWVILGNMPSSVTDKTIRRVLKPFGQVDDLKIPVSSNTSSMNVKVLFSSPTEAIQAAGALNGAQLFSRRISARLPINNTARGNGTLQDSSVRLEWDVPGRLGYAGYPSREEAEAAVSIATGSTLRDSSIGASIYEGLPTLGAATVRFVGLPPTANAQDLEKFGTPEAVMLERPNYMSLGNAVRSIQALLNEAGEVLSFEVPPPPHRDGVVRGWAHFTSPSVAQTASAHLNGRRPYFIGKGRISARHVQALSYTLPVDAYDKLASDIAWLRHSFWRQGRGAVLSVVDRRALRLHDSSIPVFIKLSGEDVGALGHLKAEFEKLLHGEKLMEDGKVVWDGFLEQRSGSFFLYEVERANPEVSIQKSIGRRTITLFGPISKRRNVRRVILEKIARIRAQKTWVIPLTGRLIGLFMSVELMELQQNLGDENVFLNLLRRTLTIRGNAAAYEAAQRAIHEVQKRHSEDRKDNVVECPVCFNEVVSPINLQCGHTWCRSCLSNYFVAAIDNKIFPLKCLGGEATCSEPIPVSIARDILSANDFDAVVNASFLAYVYSRPDEFHYCPTPDCPQIYRSAPPDTILQCPSCLARICPSCHVEAHDGITCANRDINGEKLFKEWTESHDVKSCPGCKALIERAEGCNHMTCARCQTHICWVCMETFPNGEGIYDHMRMAHGGIGL